MVSINKKDIDIFDYDTNKSFIERISSEFQILPEWIGTEIDLEQIKKEKEITIPFLVDELKKYSYDNETFVDFITELKERYKKINITALLKLFFYYVEIDDFDQISIRDLIKKIGLFDKTELKNKEVDKQIEKKIESFIQEKKELKKEIENKIKIYTEHSKELTTIYKNLDKINPKYDIKINKETSKIRLTTNIKNSEYSTDSIFSNLICFDTTPFISYLTNSNESVYKIYQDFDVIDSAWKISLKDTIILKVHTTFDTDIFDSENYIDCDIYFDNGELIINLNMNYNFIPESMIPEIIERVSRSFKNIKEFEIVNDAEVSLTESVDFENQSFNTQILSDLIMNNKMFSLFLAVDESIQASKSTSGLYTHFFLKNGDVICSINSKQEDVPYVRLLIKKVKNQEDANYIIRFFSKLITVYQTEKNNIISFYKNFIPNFGQEKVEKEEGEKKLKKLVPDLFVKGYPKKCSHPPKIITDDQLQNYDKNMVMTYPKIEDVPKGSSPHNYTCDPDVNKEHIHIGLRVNQLTNNDKYKYIPCCFKDNQKTRKSSYQEYYMGEVFEKGPQQNVLETNKFAPFEEFAILPKNINQFLKTIDDNFTYYRKGVNETPQSFLECVLEAMNDSFSGSSKKRKETILQEQYSNLIDYPEIAVASQENPGKTPENMRDILRNNDIYMDPRRWIRLCETVYNCKIILFTRKKFNQNGDIELPYHDFIYLQETPDDKKRLVIIYEHYGNEKNVSSPRCELLVRRDDNEEEENVYNRFGGKIKKDILEFYQSILRQYYYITFTRKLNVVNQFKWEKIKSLNLTSQIVDNYGKTRGLVVSHKKTPIILLSDPLPPFNLDVYSNDSKDSIYKSIPFDIVLDFINSNDLKIIKHCHMKEIVIMIDNFLFTIKIREVIVDSEMKIEIENKEQYPSENSTISIVSNTKRLSVLLIEYFIYYFSYINRRSPEFTIESIKKFIQNIKVEKASYKISTTPNLSIDLLKTNGFIKNEKFVVDCRETLKRLIYCLRLRLSNNYESVRTYYSQPEIYNFYKEVKYYATDKSNIVVKNLDDFQQIDNTVYDKLQIEKDKMFLTNPKINKNPVFLQETEDMKEAQVISSNWIRYGRIDPNLSYKPSKDETVYLYQSKNNVKIVRKNKEKGDTLVLKYKKDGTIHQLAVAEL